MKEEALKLADELEALHQYVPSEAPAMIRRLVEELDKQSEPVGRFYWESVVEGHVVALPSEGTPYYQKDDFPLYTTPQTKPLSFDVMVELGKEVDAVWDVNINGSVWFPSVDAFESFCRAIEERHGIK